MNFNHILLAVDLEAPCGDLFDFVAYQAKMSEARITVLNVLEPFRVPAELSRVIWNPERLDNMKESYENFAREQLEKLVEKHMHGQSAETVSLIAEQSAGEAIVEFAKDKSVDLIALSSHRRSVVGQFLLGSTVQKVLTLATTPVIVIPVAEKS